MVFEQNRILWSRTGSCVFHSIHISLLQDLSMPTTPRQIQPRPGRFTLSGALRGHETFESAKDDLWRLLCHLRLGPDGCDADIIPNHFLTRDKIQKSIPKWQNLLQHQLACADAVDKLPAMRVSRQQAWIESCEKFRSEHAPSLPPSISVSTGHIVAVQHQKAWHVALVMSTWRCYKRSTGAQLCPREVSKGSLHSARVALMRKVDGDKEGHYASCLKRTFSTTFKVLLLCSSSTLHHCMWV